VATIAERTLELLEQGPLDDDQLGDRLGVVRQQVNQVCRLLASRGVLIREVGSRGKIENRLPSAGHASGSQVGPEEAPSVIPSRTSATAASAARLDIEGNLAEYVGDREPTARYASFDYCFNHFQAFREDGRASDLGSPDNLELSCLHVGFYLASWGMLRGSTDLLKRSIKHLVPTIETIAMMQKDVWELDAHAYDETSIGLLLDTAASLRTVLPDASNILVTKVMLGVFGCVPAFDTFFKKGFAVSTFGRKALRKVASFYQENAETIEAHRVATLDFATGTDSGRLYPRAKVIDMIFFIQGMRSGVKA
jgi:biotin operon repressor